MSSDCSRCLGLCCVALPYGESADFPKDKPSGVPCENLSINNDCQIHDQLRNCGFKGCVTYECFGAGQYVSQVIYIGESWRENKDLADDMFTVFPIVQQIHEMLFYLSQALEVAEDKHKHSLSFLQDELLEQTRNLTLIRTFNVSDYRGRVGTLLEEVSRTYRKAYIQKQLKSNYIGVRISGSLAGQSLRGKLLIGANGNHANFQRVDF
ncbi:pentapeptide repeat-containing protein [Shouchella sp. JSM 1781072]|uniref:pentapeptide repeat-containing protein n=1 Tax=Shouchella sp. JSM 1781072 TaxID=3344581 RepID=UPI0035C01A46